MGSVEWLTGEYSSKGLWLVDWNVVRDLKYVSLGFSSKGNGSEQFLTSAELFVPPACYLTKTSSRVPASSEIGRLKDGNAIALPQGSLMYRLAVAVRGKSSASRPSSENARPKH